MSQFIELELDWPARKLFFKVDKIWILANCTATYQEFARDPHTVYARTAKELEYHLLTSIQTLIHVALTAMANAAVDETLARIFRKD
jgi:hypothetical protein